MGEALSSMIEQNETIRTLKLSGLLIDLKSELLARSLLKNTILERRVITNHAVTSAPLACSNCIILIFRVTCPY